MASGIYKDKERGTYFVDKLYHGYRIKKRGFSTMTEAKAFLFSEVYKLDNPFEVEKRTKENATINDLYHDWFSVKRTEIRSVTIQAYQNKYRVHIEPYFGSRLLSSLTSNDLSTWKQSIANKGFTSDRVNELITTLRLMLKYAIENDYTINKKIIQVLNPVKQTITLQEREILTYEEIDQFLKSFNANVKGDEFFYNYFYCFSRSGMRPNEFRGLQVKNIKGNYLIVDHDITNKLKGQGLVIQPTKNTSSVRKVLMPEECMKIINKIVKGYGSNDFIFGKDKPVAETTLRRALDSHLEMAGLKHVTIYSFRHSHATHLIRSGVPIKVVSQRLGHSSPTMTMKVYWHLFKEDEESVLKFL